MNLQRLDPDDDAAVTAAMALGEAARAADTPYNPPSHRRSFVGHLRYGWDGEPSTVWLLHHPDRSGEVIGRLSLGTSERDNLHLTDLGITVHPEHRRQGIGRALFEEGLARVRASGRRLIVTGTVEAPGPCAFAKAMGFTRASIEVQRRQDLTAVDHAHVGQLLEQARKASTDYSLLRFVDAVPEEHVEQIAAMTAAINDAPTDDLDVEDEVFTAERIRAFEHAFRESGSTLYRLVARRESDGELAGHTIVGASPEQPDFAYQLDTAVLGAHRGHRLGLLLKAEMMAWIAQAEPAVRWIDTWNAESNAHMISINEALGYQIVSRHFGWQRDV
ncbi:GNAT family N-acetyltransferase [Actinopolymorpha pittospori]